MQLFHHYNRQGQPNIFRDRPEDWYHLQIKSNARAKWILQLGNSTKPADSDESELSYQYYGMGEARTLQQYWDFAGQPVKPYCPAEPQLSLSNLHMNLGQPATLPMPVLLLPKLHLILCCPRLKHVAAMLQRLPGMPQPLPPRSAAMLHLMGAAQCSCIRLL